MKIIRLLQTVREAVMPRRKLRCIHNGKRLYYPRRQTLLYYIKFAPKGRAPIYKIGITTQSVEQRFKYEKIPYTVIFTVTYSGGREAYIEEQRILLEYHDYLLPYQKILKSGNSELFYTDIRQHSNKGSL